MSPVVDEIDLMRWANLRIMAASDIADFWSFAVLMGSKVYVIVLLNL